MKALPLEVVAFLSSSSRPYPTGDRLNLIRKVLDSGHPSDNHTRQQHSHVADIQAPACDKSSTAFMATPSRQALPTRVLSNKNVAYLQVLFLSTEDLDGFFSRRLISDVPMDFIVVQTNLRNLPRLFCEMGEYYPLFSLMFLFTAIDCQVPGSQEF